MQTDSPSSTPTQPAPKTVAGGGAGLGHVLVGGGYTLSDDQMQALKTYAHLCCSIGDFAVLRDWVELQIDKARLDAAYEAASKATTQAFAACQRAMQP